MSTIVIATPHARYDRLESELRARLKDSRIVRLRNKEELTVDRLAELEPRYVFFPHWSWMIPVEVHSRFECVVFHMTDLPYGRGGSPLQNLIVRGHSTTKLTALRCERGLDAGPIYLKRNLSLNGTAEEIFGRAAGLMVGMIVDIATTNPEPIPQSGEVVSFERRQPKDGNIAAATSLSQCYDYIRMLDADGYPRAYAEVERFRLEFSDATMVDGRLEARVVIREKSNE